MPRPNSSSTSWEYAAQEAGEAEGGEVVGLGHAHQGVGGDQLAAPPRARRGAAPAGPRAARRESAGAGAGPPGRGPWGWARGCAPPGRRAGSPGPRSGAPGRGRAPRRRPGRPGPGGLQGRSRAALEAAVEQVVGLLEGLDVGPGDVQPGVQLPQLEIGLGHLGRGGQVDAAAGVLGGQVLGQGGLVQPAQPAPEVQLPRERGLGADAAAGDPAAGHVVGIAAAGVGRRPGRCRDSSRCARCRPGPGTPPPAAPPCARRSCAPGPVR